MANQEFSYQEALAYVSGKLPAYYAQNIADEFNEDKSDKLTKSDLDDFVAYYADF